MIISAFWRRLDIPGHDACCLKIEPDGLYLQGTTVFGHSIGAFRIEYDVRCESNGITKSGNVKAKFRDQNWDIKIERSRQGFWFVNGEPVKGLEMCFDIDFGFTPATNALQLRRLSMKEGERKNVPVAWINFPEPSLILLEERYERKSKNRYWYQACSFGYCGFLEVNENGFAVVYPNLWEMEIE